MATIMNYGVAWWQADFFTNEYYLTEGSSGKFYYNCFPNGDLQQNGSFSGSGLSVLDGSTNSIGHKVDFTKIYGAFSSFSAWLSGDSDKTVEIKDFTIPADVVLTSVMKSEHEPSVAVWSQILAGDDIYYSPSKSVTGGDGTTEGITTGSEINGYGGINTAIYKGNFSDYNVSTASEPITVADKFGNEQDMLYGFQFLKFDDQTIDLRTMSNSDYPSIDASIPVTTDNSTIYRLYQASFARMPDRSGFNYWVAQHEKGLGIKEISTSFLNSSEFLQKYGTTTSNADLVSLLYENILGREGEPAGMEYWINQLDSGKSTRIDVLVGFSESPENISNTSQNIETGYWLL